MPHIRKVAAADERFVAGSGNYESLKRIVVTQFSYHVYETLFAPDAECVPFFRIVEGHARDASGFAAIVKINQNEVLDV